MSSSYIPNRDSEFKPFAVNLSAYVTAHTVALGLIAGQATALAALVTSFNAALLATDTPATRTRVTIDAKNVARAALESEIRALVAQMRAYAGTTDADLLAMGLPVYDTTKTPVAAPATQPIMSIISATPLQQTLRYADSATPTSRAKAPGAAGLQVFVQVTSTETPSPDNAKFTTFATKQPFVVNFNSADKGKTATYYTRWQTSTGLLGPWSTPVSMTVAG